MDLTERADDPNVQKIFEDIKFLITKLHYLKNEIIKEYDKFQKSVVDMSRGNVNRLKSDLIGKGKLAKDNTMEIRFEDAYISAQADNELFFHIDTLFIDVKRVVEFTLRFLGLTEGGDLGDFALENFIKQLEGDRSQTPSRFLKKLIANYSQYVDYLKETIPWLKSLNWRRTRAVHFEIFNKTGDFKVIYEFNSVKSLDDEPTVIMQPLRVLGEEIPSLIDLNVENAKNFFAQTFNLKRELFKKVQTI